MTFNLDGRTFRPISNSEGGRVDNDTFFKFRQTGIHFTANYSGPDVTDGHIIGTFISETTASLLYHSRAKSGELEAGQSTAEIQVNHQGRLTLTMKWAWLNGSMKSGTSEYIEVAGR